MKPIEFEDGAVQVDASVVAEGLGVASLAAAGVAVWLTLRPGAEAPDGRTARVELAPMIARQAAGLVVVGGF